MRFQSRPAVCIGAALLVGLSLFALWPRKSDEQPPDPSVRIQEAVSNVVHEAKARMKGGIGVMLSGGAARGFPRVEGVVPGSPAALAGLEKGDLITHVNGKSLAALPLIKAVDSIRGFTATSLELTVVRSGETNPISLVVRRASFKSLKIAPL